MPSTNTLIANAGFHHIAINARDFDKSVAFYSALGCKAVVAWGAPPKRAVMMDIGDDARVEIFERPDRPDDNGSGVLAHFCFRTSNTDDAYAKALAAGGVSHVAPKDVVIDSTPAKLPVRLAFVKGPDAEILEFFQVK